MHAAAADDDDVDAVVDDVASLKIEKVESPTKNSGHFGGPQRQLNVALKRSAGGVQDFVPTPTYATLTLINHPFMSPFYKKRAFECCNGQGHISDVLIKSGFATDVIRRDKCFEDKNGLKYDFLTDEPPPADSYDYIVTNPPYSMKREFISKCLELNKPTFLLIPMDTFATVAYHEMLQEKLNGKLDIIYMANLRFFKPTSKTFSTITTVAWVAINTGYHVAIPRMVISFTPLNQCVNVMSYDEYDTESEYPQFEEFIAHMIEDKFNPNIVDDTDDVESGYEDDGNDVCDVCGLTSHKDYSIEGGKCWCEKCYTKKYHPEFVSDEYEEEEEEEPDPAPANDSDEEDSDYEDPDKELSSEEYD